MNIKNSVSVYPSYRGIEQEIQRRYLQNYQQKISNLRQHLNNLQHQHHFDLDHQKIKASILNLSAENPHHQEQPDEKIKLHQKKSSGLSLFQGQSLNYYIEDDGEEESNYEAYLKFKKKALERDLQEEQLSKMGLNSHQKKKQKEEEELFFRRLYLNKENKDPSSKRKNLSKKVSIGKYKGSGFNYQDAKVSATSFLTKVQRGQGYRSQKDLKQTRNHKSGIDKQTAAFEKNRKYLKENYFQILKKLEGTNIVKWRVLNSDMEQRNQ